MKKFFKYLKYVIRHKYFVFLESCKLGIPIRGLVHDTSKFFPDEFFPYMNHFYGHVQKQGYIKQNDTIVDPQFDRQWLKHIHRNKHHWQYWILVENYNDHHYKIQKMPLKYTKEMLADWIGASRQQGFGTDISEWYNKHKDKIKIHSSTRKWLEDHI